MATKKTVKKTTKTAAAPAQAAKKTAKKPVKSAPAKAAPKTTTKATPKTTVKSTASVVKPEVESTKKVSVSTPESAQQTIKVRKPYLFLIIIIVLLGAALYYFRGLFVAAVVNGQPISRLQVVQQAEKQEGKQTLDTLVRNALIEQEAKKANVTVSDKEVNDEIATLQNNLKRQGQNFDQVLSAQGMTIDDLRRLIHLDKLVQKMVGKNVKVSDQEINNYIDKNKSALPSTDDATLKKQVKAQLTQQKTNMAVQTWLADVQKRANIVYFVQY